MDTNNIKDSKKAKNKGTTIEITQMENNHPRKGTMYLNIIEKMRQNEHFRDILMLLLLAFCADIFISLYQLRISLWNSGFLGVIISFYGLISFAIERI
jgi:hypothetical protein